MHNGALRDIKISVGVDLCSPPTHSVPCMLADIAPSVLVFSSLWSHSLNCVVISFLSLIAIVISESVWLLSTHCQYDSAKPRDCPALVRVFYTGKRDSSWALEKHPLLWVGQEERRGEGGDFPPFPPPPPGEGPPAEEVAEKVRRILRSPPPSSVGKCA